MLTSPPGHTALTNAQFLLTESALVAQSLLDGLTWADLRRSAREGHLFGPGKANSQLTVLGALKTRLQDIPDEVLPELAHGTLEARQILMLALVTRQKPLVRAFISDVLLYKWQRLEVQVTDADARTFLTHQADQHPEMAQWSPATMQKTRGNLTRFLLDAGLLKERRKGEFETVPQHLSARLKAMVQQLDPPLFPLLEALK
ncbi:DUF1819 family protein [Deinococcus aquaedulcis]|uniref:DUF1819 family protein n=1 Tax=Deinococcus aquaedulcis TaxID=2840455 RepID=UPI001C830187|nr:DUF1819 family protein [Deinococcus aquaedulcis]